MQVNFGRLNFAVAALLSCAIASAGPVTHVLDTTSYNFQLDGGGGGAKAVLDKTTTIEIFCVDYANDITVPHSNYSADISTIGSGADLSATRFGAVTSWTTLSNQGSFVDASTINALTGAGSALGRYEMAAYLVSTYNLKSNPTNSPSNDGIQQAIWDILDPKGEVFGNIAPASNTDNALEAAAKWYSTTSASARDSFLSNYRIISDASLLTSCKGQLVNCGFQEQITVVPEPRYLALMLIGLLAAGSAAFRKLRTAQSVKA